MTTAGAWLSAMVTSLSGMRVSSSLIRPLKPFPVHEQRRQFGCSGDPPPGQVCEQSETVSVLNMSYF